MYKKLEKKIWEEKMAKNETNNIIKIKIKSNLRD